MKKGKKILSGILAASMLMAVTACGGDDTSSSADTSSADNTVQTEDAGSDAGAQSEDSGSEAGTQKDYSEKITVSWAEVIEGDEGIDYTQDDVYKAVQEKFNLDIEVTPLTWGNWVENLRIWINSGDMPDVVNWNYVHSEFMDYVDQGLVRKLDDDWKERWPETAKLYALTGIGEELDELLGGTYCLPVPIYFNNKPAETLTQHYQTYMRKDWIEAVGVEVKDYYTYDEFLDLARKMKEQDPGNVGTNFYPITSYSNMLVSGLVYQMYEHSSPDKIFYKGDDGKYRWGGADEETYEALKWVQDAWKEGLIHPEFYTLNQGEDEDMMTIAGTSAIFWAGGLSSNYSMFANEMSQNGLNPDESLLSAFLVDNDGKFHGLETANYFGALLFNPDMDDATFERVMDVIEFSCTQEGQLLMNLGFEGVEYEVESDGSLKALTEADPLSTYPSIRFFQTFATRRDDFQIINPSTPQQYRDKQVEQYQDKYSLLTDDTLAKIDWDVVFHSSNAMNQVQFTYPDEYSQLIVKDGDLRENWQNWVDEKMSLIQPVLDELNAK